MCDRCEEILDYAAERMQEAVAEVATAVADVAYRAGKTGMEPMEMAHHARAAVRCALEGIGIECEGDGR